GTVDDQFDPITELEKRLGKPLPERETLRAAVEARSLHQLIAQGLQPGVIETLQQATKLGLKIGLASSSNRDWVESHLQRLKIMHYFHCIRTFSDVGSAKPDPELYLSVLDYFTVLPQEAIALEDSPNGIQAARTAGIFCIAIPNSLTRHLDLSQANLRLQSLTELNLHQLQHQFNGQNQKPDESTHQNMAREK
ncbi:MAG: HAD family hydrolase, partial [Anaerolineales bacterium]